MDDESCRFTGEKQERHMMTEDEVGGAEIRPIAMYDHNSGLITNLEKTGTTQGNIVGFEDGV